MAAAARAATATLHQLLILHLQLFDLPGELAQRLFEAVDPDRKLAIALILRRILLLLPVTERKLGLRRSGREQSGRERDREKVAH
ncbi:MAG: hypothetical protein IPK23_13165 [Rhizobiales bacterium]|nr:hypothetical protein [Hyphomicrobiales bacterium]